MDRPKMLQVNMDSDSDNQLNHKSSQRVTLDFKDKFKTFAISKGMFHNEDQDIDYKTITVLPVTNLLFNQQQSYPNQPNIIQEIQHGDLESQNKIEVRFGGKQQRQINYGEDITSLVFTHQMMEMSFSSDEGSKEELQQESNINQPLSCPENKLNQIQQIDTKQLLQGITDICQFSRIFCLKPIPQNRYLKLSIYRDSSGLNSFWPEFKIFIGKFCQQFLFAKKMIGSTTSNYYISSEEGVQKVDHINFIGKLRSNSTGSLYNIFDKEVSPQKGSKSIKKRSIQATIRFKSQTLAMQPRQFQLFMLKPGVKYDTLDSAIPNKQIGLDVLYEQQANKQKIYFFKNRKPAYSNSLKGFILNFSGRVQVPSVKNFILQDIHTKREVLMLGKTNENIFRADVSSPIPPFIALCVCLANIDSKFISD